MKFTLVTYNILHGYHTEQILENIKLLIYQGADVICIQEAEISIEKILSAGGGWQIEYYKYGVGCMLATLWNESKVSLEDTKTILYKSLSKPSFSQKLTDYKNYTIPRGALITCFSVGGKILRITNTHLAWEGGNKQRLLQLGTLQNILSQKSVDYEILAGDFNTAAPAMFRRIEEKKIENKLKGWTNVFPNIAYTQDVSYTDPKDGVEWIAKLLRSLGIKFRQRLDYVFTKNLKTISKEMLDLPGSDHRPLVATFES